MADKFKQWISRPQIWGFLVSMVIMTIISLAFFYPDNFQGNSLHQGDMLQGQAIGQEAKQYKADTGEQALWTNSIFGGMPTFQISPSYPSNRLFNWLNSLYGLFLPNPSNLLFMMMMGMLICLYCLKVRWPYALIGAIAWGFSSYFIIIIGAGHIWKFLALTYIPPTIGGLILCYRNRWIVGGAMTALFAMLQLNANHPQMSYYFAWVMVALVIGALVVAITNKRVKEWVYGTISLALAGCLAIGANLPSIYHTYKYAAQTKRATSELVLEDAQQKEGAERPTGGMPRSQILGWSYGISETFSLAIPNVKGGATVRPEAGRSVYMSLDKLPGASSYQVLDQNTPADYILKQFPQYFNESEGTNGPVYVGVIIVALFLLGCTIVQGPIKWVMVIMTCVSIVLAWGINMAGLSDWMIYHFPMYNKFRAVESILVIAEFCMPLLGIIALQKILTTRDAWTKYQQSFLLCFGLVALICLLGWLFPGMFGEALTSKEKSILAQFPIAYRAVESLRLGMVSSDAWRSFALVIVAGGTLFIAMRQKENNYRWAATAIIGILILGDMYGVDKRYVSHDCFAQGQLSTEPTFSPDQIDQTILQDGKDELQYRVADLPGMMSSDRSYFHRMVGGYHAAKLGRYDDLLTRRIIPVAQQGYYPQLRSDSASMEYPQDQQALIKQLQTGYRVLDMLNTRYIIDFDENNDNQQYIVLNPYALGPAWLVGQIEYVEGANAEMDALDTLDPAVEAVAAKEFEPILGNGAQMSVGDHITMESYAPGKLSYNYNTTKDGVIAVFSEIYFPWGWYATIDGIEAPIGRVDYVLRAMQLPAGRHKIEMVFAPKSMRTTSGVAYASVTIIYLWVLLAIASMVRGRRNNNPKDDLLEVIENAIDTEGQSKNGISRENRAKEDKTKKDTQPRDNRKGKKSNSSNTR